MYSVFVPQKYTNSNPYVQLFVTILLGLMIGSLAFAFVKLLAMIAEMHRAFNAETPLHLAAAPVVLLLLVFIKKRTLFFPTKVSEITDEVSSHYWSSAMGPVNFFGPLLAHFSGMSVGREGAVVLFSSGLVRWLKLSWSFWGPIAAGIGFSAAVGNYWVAPIFVSELFFATSFTQKLFSFLGAMVAVTLGRELQMPHLFSSQELVDNMGFFSKLWFLIFFAVSTGYVMRIYKFLHHYLVEWFSLRHMIWRLAVAGLLAAVLFVPDLRFLQSLGLERFHDLNNLQGSLPVALMKLALTVVSTSVGFLGGDFVPLVFAGSYWGAGFFESFGFSSQLGGSFGAFMLFAAATRLKWTAYILILSLMGWSWFFWVFIVVGLCTGFSGDRSVYRKSDLEDL